MKTYPTKFYNDKMQGAPKHETHGLNQLINTLTPILVTGFGDTVCDSLVFDAEKGWAKATFANGHAFQKFSVIEIQDASVADYNGEHRIMLISTNDVWFELDSVPSGDATGSLMRYPSLGWTIEHVSGDGEQIIYKPKGDQGDVYLYVDNSEYSGAKVSYGRNACVMMVTDVVDINTWERCYTYDDSTDYWQSSGDYDTNINGNGADRFAYHLFGDGSIFNYLPAIGYNQYRYSGYTAGYINSYRTEDRYHFVCGGGYKSKGCDGNVWGGSNQTNGFALVIARDYHQQKGDCRYYAMRLFNGSTNFYTNMSPNQADNGFYIADSNALVIARAGQSPIYDTVTPQNTNLRGEMPCVREVFGKMASGFIEKENKLLYVEELCSVYTGTSTGSDSYQKSWAFDISTVEV